MKNVRYKFARLCLGLGLLALAAFPVAAQNSAAQNNGIWAAVSGNSTTMGMGANGALALGSSVTSTSLPSTPVNLSGWTSAGNYGVSPGVTGVTVGSNVNMPLPGGRSVPVQVAAKIKPLAMAAGLISLAKFVPVLGNGIMIYDFIKELGFDATKNPDLSVNWWKPGGSCTVGPCYEYKDFNLNVWYPRKLYIPEADYDDPDLIVNEIDQTGTLMDEERKERMRELSRKRDRAKAKTKCRHAIKSHALCQLATGTYRDNMTDFGRIRLDYKAWVRIMVRYIPGFRAVFAFEPQERGAWHWHAAIDKLPPFIIMQGVKVRSFDFARRMWQRVVGHDNGTVNFDGHNKTKAGTPAVWNKKQSLAKIAAYVSKYLTKDVDSAIEGRNMWGRSQGLSTIKPVTFELPFDITIEQAIVLSWQRPSGHRIVRHSINERGDFWLLYTEPE